MAIIGLIFSPALLGFFSGDDWAVMRVSEIKSPGEFLNFFSLIPTTQSLTFYRPLPQQIFFFVFHRLFGLNPFPYYLCVLACFLLSLYFLYRLAIKLKFSHLQSLLTVLFYGVAVANFARIYFLSAFQDVLLPLFVILSLLTYIDKKISLSILFFVLALLSKETAVVIPPLIFWLILYSGGKHFVKLIPYFVILALYLFFRLKFFGGAAGDSYLWDFSITKVLNTFLWYCLWAIGTPEIMVDYVGSGLRIVPKFFTDFPVWNKIILLELGSLFISLIAQIAFYFKEFTKKSGLVIFCLFFFLISLSPVIFMPWHKFSHALSLPMVGSSLLLGYFFSKPKLLTKIFITLYLVTNISMMLFMYPRFYSVNRGKISRLVYEFFSKNYPLPPGDSYFLFVNDPTGYKGGEDQSKELSLALSSSDFFQIFYRDPDYRAYFVDLHESIPLSGKTVPIDSGQFLRRY